MTNPYKSKIENSSSGVSYLPIIKWQANEMRAIVNVEPQHRQFVLPCFEVRDKKQHDTFITTFADNWGSTALIDYSNPNGQLTRARSIQLLECLSQLNDSNLIPVIDPSDDSAVAVFDQLYSNSICNRLGIRLRVHNFQILERDIDRCVRVSNEFQNLCYCLVIDFGLAPHDFSVVGRELLVNQIQRLENLGVDHIFIVSGSFPAALAEARNGTKEFPRHDKRFWDYLLEGNRCLSCKFGDYGTLAPGWSEETLIRRAGAVAIRYTCDDHWFVLRGENMTKEESIALSDLLVNVHQHKFQGEGFSWGDKIIAERADLKIPAGKKKAGGYHIAEALNHHIYFVLKKDLSVVEITLNQFG